ncbi:MAG: hypothetical protein HY453_00620 [Parcubacteria group bacterium]|nr:hypothetical protein [Parcubacteria group bacterium]
MTIKKILIFFAIMTAITGVSAILFVVFVPVSEVKQPQTTSRGVELIDLSKHEATSIDAISHDDPKISAVPSTEKFSKDWYALASRLTDGSKTHDTKEILETLTVESLQPKDERVSKDVAVETKRLMERESKVCGCFEEKNAWESFQGYHDEIGTRLEKRMNEKAKATAEETQSLPSIVAAAKNELFMAGDIINQKLLERDIETKFQDYLSCARACPLETEIIEDAVVKESLDRFAKEFENFSSAIILDSDFSADRGCKESLAQNRKRFSQTIAEEDTSVALLSAFLDQSFLGWNEVASIADAEKRYRGQEQRLLSLQKTFESAAKKRIDANSEYQNDLHVCPTAAISVEVGVLTRLWDAFIGVWKELFGDAMDRLRHRVEQLAKVEKLRLTAQKNKDQNKVDRYLKNRDILEADIQTEFARFMGEKYAADPNREGIWYLRLLYEEIMAFRDQHL